MINLGSFFKETCSSTCENMGNFLYTYQNVAESFLSEFASKFTTLENNAKYTKTVLFATGVIIALGGIRGIFKSQSLKTKLISFTVVATGTALAVTELMSVNKQSLPNPTQESQKYFYNDTLTD